MQMIPGKLYRLRKKRYLGRIISPELGKQDLWKPGNIFLFLKETRRDDIYQESFCSKSVPFLEFQFLSPDGNIVRDFLFRKSIGRTWERIDLEE